MSFPGLVPTEGFVPPGPSDFDLPPIGPDKTFEMFGSSFYLGVTTPMLVKLGQNEVKTVEDLAGCATDDLIGWTEKDQRNPGFLAEFELSREQAEAIIMAARVKAGWIEATPEPTAEEGEAAEAAE